MQIGNIQRRLTITCAVQAKSDGMRAVPGSKGLTLEISGRPGPVTMVLTPGAKVGPELEGDST